MFEYDQNKSDVNEKKHGIGFEDAQEIWTDLMSVVVPSRKPGSEERFLRIGLARGKVWSAIYTTRRGKIRIISVRRARDNEREVYYESE
jgi:uncharacterized DUF497 family protein